MVTTENRLFASICHAAPLVGIGTIVVPLLVLLLKADDPFVRSHAIESLNFHISMVIYCIIAGLLCLILVGFVLLAVIGIASLIMLIFATIAAAQGEDYRYPMIIRLVK